MNSRETLPKLQVYLVDIFSAAFEFLTAISSHWHVEPESEINDMHKRLQTLGEECRALEERLIQWDRTMNEQEWERTIFHVVLEEVRAHQTGVPDTQDSLVSMPFDARAFSPEPLPFQMEDDDFWISPGTVLRNFPLEPAGQTPSITGTPLIPCTAEPSPWDVTCTEISPRTQDFFNLIRFDPTPETSPRQSGK